MEQMMDGEIIPHLEMLDIHHSQRFGCGLRRATCFKWVPGPFWTQIATYIEDSSSCISCGNSPGIAQFTHNPEGRTSRVGGAVSSSQESKKEPARETQCG